MSAKMSLEADDVSIDSLKMLWYGRFHPAVNYRWARILTIINLSVCSLFLILAVKGVIVSYNTDIFFMAECLQTCILMTHAIGKLLVVHIQRKNILKLVEHKASFWKIKSFDGNIFNECSTISNLVKNIIRYYYCLGLMACLLFDVQPFATGYLPTVCYVPPGWFNFLTIVLWYLSFVLLLGLTGTDGFFCSLGTSLVIQFKLLAHEFKAANIVKTESETKLFEKLKELIQYHDFLLSYCADLNVSFKGVFLVQFLNTIASASLSVFIFMQPENWTNRIKFGMYFLTMIVESAFYCVPSEFVVNAASKIGDAFYESNWYEIKIVQFKKSLIVILARTQKAVAFSGYGLIHFNLRTFVQICKTVFSFYTYLSSVEKISN